MLKKYDEMIQHDVIAAALLLDYNDDPRGVEIEFFEPQKARSIQECTH